ncbi:hypothetical protein JMJ55_03635 [Belnapia sp. T6]|uniref:Uncharacterized protein n=1 Tax=Belnapia mucosa TaxID=2804532 RepID=A0ABS1UZG2_9PROT|nr:hypothetical protein [Belnapia mucosa]MBL6454402.1 hypothetical protein [Belnapia mucosa]
MTYAERVQHWNRLYDQAPENLRFNVLVGMVLLIGAVNMWLTVAIGFPFALLMILAIGAIAAIRLPQAMGWVQPHPEAPGRAQLRIEGADSLYRWNQWYDGLSEAQQSAVLLVVLLGAGIVNMLLTIGSGFPFGLIFLLAILALAAIRGPYVSGWLVPPAAGPMLDAAPGAPLLHQDAAASPAVEHQNPIPGEPLARD